MELRQLLVAVARSEALRSNRTSFSASAKVEVETAGPTSGAVPKAGGAPGVETAVPESTVGLRHAAKTAKKAVEARFRKRRREFDMF